MNKSKYKGNKLLEKLPEKTYKKVNPRTLQGDEILVWDV